MRTIWISEMSNHILTVPFNNGSEEKRGIPITLSGLVLLSSLNVVSLLFGKDFLMSLHKLVLEVMILLIWGLRLLIK